MTPRQPVSSLSLSDSFESKTGGTGFPEKATKRSLKYIMDRKVVLCTDCGTPFAGRIDEKGIIILPTQEGTCSECGGATFAEAKDNATGDD